MNITECPRCHAHVEHASQDAACHRCGTGIHVPSYRDSIRNKDEFNALSQAGRLGNFLRSWGSPMEALDNDYNGPYTIRNRVPGSPHFVPVCLTADDLLWSARALVERGARWEDIYVTEIPPPDTHRIINFEAALTHYGVTMVFERDTTNPVRGIRERGTWVEGLRAQMVLRTLLSPGSYDALQEIWEQHPTSVIEATEWSEPCGAFHQPLTIWECRDY